MRDQVHIAQIVTELDRQNLLPAIVFRTARAQCDVDAERAVANPRLRLSPMAQREIRAKVQEIASSYDMDLALLTSHPHYNSLVSTGVGAHHAGQLLMWRLLVWGLLVWWLLVWGLLVWGLLVWRLLVWRLLV